MSGSYEAAGKPPEPAPCCVKCGSTDVVVFPVEHKRYGLAQCVPCGAIFTLQLNDDAPPK